MKITSTQHRKTVSFSKPVIRRTEIGRKPAHHFDQNPQPKEAYVATEDPLATGGSVKVWADIPKKRHDGSPVMQSVRETLDLAPRNPWKRGGIAGGVGVLVGAGAGALLSGVAGLHPGVGAAVGGLAIGGIAGGVGAWSVYGEKTELVWDQHQIRDHKMVGYRELVGPGEKDSAPGYFHRYLPDIESQTIGTYQTPRVVRYKGDSAPEETQKPPREIPQEKSPKEPGKKLDATVTWEKERLQNSYLGSIPHDYHSYSSSRDRYVSCDSGQCDTGGRKIYRHTPVYEPDGKPRVDAVTQRFQASSYSVPLFAAGGAVAGGAVGAGIGLLVSHLTGLPSGLTTGVGAGVGGLATAIGAGIYAAGDQVNLEWRENAIQEQRLAGYTHHVAPHFETRCTTQTDRDGQSTQHCETYQNGWDHSFTPDVRTRKVGTYVGPKVVHSQE